MRTKKKKKRNNNPQASSLFFVFFVVVDVGSVLFFLACAVASAIQKHSRSTVNSYRTDQIDRVRIENESKKRPIGPILGVDRRSMKQFSHSNFLLSI